MGYGQSAAPMAFIQLHLQTWKFIGIMLFVSLAQEDGFVGVYAASPSAFAEGRGNEGSGLPEVRFGKAVAF